MSDEFGGLESKVTQVISLCAALRTENHRLRDRVGELEDEKLTLTERMSTARLQLESLMDRLPPE
jgi:cell division protein ZapB